jgi:NADH-quinone oxidoreductase subunit I
MANYIQGLFHGIRTLLTGLKVTGKEFVTPKITEQYPENRATLKMNERFCGTLTMPHDAEGKNKCVACGLCQAACPNGTIKKRRASPGVVWSNTNTTWEPVCSATCA